MDGAATDARGSESVRDVVGEGGTVKIGSLFAGVGGFDKGFEDVGFTCAWQVEIENFPVRVLERHWSNVRRVCDVRDAGKHNLDPVDVVTFGFPCQDVSVAGRREGLAGSRTGLFWEAHRILAELAPRWFVAENVPGLYSSFSPLEAPPFTVHPREFDTREEAEEWASTLGGTWDVDEASDLEAVIGSLVELGYGVAWRVLDAQWCGLAQRRDRVFIVGCLGDWNAAAEVLFEPESSVGDTPPSRSSRARVTGTIAAGAYPDSYNGQDAYTGMFVTSPDGSGKEDDLSPTLDTRSKDGPRRNQGGVSIISMRSANTSGNGWGVSEDVTATLDEASPHIVCLKGAAIDREPENGPQYGEVQQDGITYTLNATEIHAVCGPLKSRGYKGPNAEDAAEGQLVVDWVADVHCTLRAEAGPPKCASDDSRLIVVPTLSTKNEVASNSTQMFGAVRRLTPTECEALQGFPRDWTLLEPNTPDGPRYKAIGNAVAVPVARWIGRRIMAVGGGRESG